MSGHDVSDVSDVSGDDLQVDEPPATGRRAELAENLGRVHARIDAACRAAGRAPAEVTLIAVTKTWPASDAVHLRELGVVDLGENRDQEASRKAMAVTGVRWHFIGSLQTNKARSVASYAAVVHSLDRAALCAALGREAMTAGRTIEALVQVSLDGDPARGGTQAHDVPALAALVSATDGLTLRGVSAVAPRDDDPARAFAQLQAIATALVAEHPAATVVSAGMSADLEQAIEAGATHVRVGTAVLGARSAPLR